MFLLSYGSWVKYFVQIRNKLQKLFPDKLTCSTLKIVFTSPSRDKNFSPSGLSYFQDLLTRISVVAAMLPIMVRQITA